MFEEAAWYKDNDLSVVTGEIGVSKPIKVYVKYNSGKKKIEAIIELYETRQWSITVVPKP